MKRFDGTHEFITKVAFPIIGAGIIVYQAIDQNTEHYAVLGAALCLCFGISAASYWNSGFTIRIRRDDEKGPKKKDEGTLSEEHDEKP